MGEDGHYYLEGYSADTDPYAQENGVLKNYFGITDLAKLNEIEADIAGLQIQKLLKQAPPYVLTPKYLCDLHHQVFMEIYPWAGKFRQVDIAKGDTHFLKHTAIEQALETLFSSLNKIQNHKNSSLENFSQTIGKFLVGLNYVHPFREGNGRVQRLLASQIAKSSGFNLDWQSVGNEAMKQASIAGVAGDTRQMARLILLNTH